LIDEEVAQLKREVTAMREQLAGVIGSLSRVEGNLELIKEMTGSELDRIPEASAKLAEVRLSDAYEQSFIQEEPLVTIRIATYNRSRTLVDRAVASALSQTYENVEVIVVGDGCTDDTEHLIRSIGDPRLRFVNRTFNGPYPQDDHRRWLVVGSPAMNLGAQLANGLWIAPLDDDDEFALDHVEVLLQAARHHRYEMVYGQILQRCPGSPSLDNIELCQYPPASHKFGFQAAIYTRSLRFFEYNTKSWLLDEPGDWNLCRRMIEAGVLIGWIDRIVTYYYPSSQYA
jgi:glycosyltransferase involved in cell wall biosynthesis